MTPAKLAKRLRKLADELEIPPVSPTFEVMVSVIQVGDEYSTGGMHPTLTAYQVLVADGIVAESELPRLDPGARIQIKVVRK